MSDDTSTDTTASEPTKQTTPTPTQQTTTTTVDCPICPQRQLNSDGFCQRCGYQDQPA